MIFEADAIPVLRCKKIMVSVILTHIIYTCMMLAECDYQIMVTGICNGCRISYISTNITLSISALHSETLCLLVIK